MLHLVEKGHSGSLENSPFTFLVLDPNGFEPNPPPVDFCPKALVDEPNAPPPKVDELEEVADPNGFDFGLEKEVVVEPAPKAEPNVGFNRGS